MKNKLTAILCWLIFIYAPLTHARQPDKSLGIIVGDPTGISAKYWLPKGLIGTGGQQAFDAAVGWKFVGNFGIQIKLDYVVHQYGVIPVEVGKLPIYYGMGARLVAGDKGNIGVRIPIGVNYLLDDEPFGGFLELAPVLGLLPETTMDLSIALGARYRFY